MILIKKMQAPPELESLKKEAEKLGLSDKEGYDKLRNPLKSQVRESLVKEQGHLCAYCMRRIPDERILKDDVHLSDVYIEHWQARGAENRTGENKGLDYRNMFAVCSGNENAPLKINPIDEKTLETIYYLTDGTIKASDPEIDFDINTHLNLNCCTEAVTLPENRKRVLDTIQEELVNQDGDLRQNCIEQLHMWESEEDPKTPYIGIAIWWLKEQIAQLEI